MPDTSSGPDFENQIEKLLKRYNFKIHNYNIYKDFFEWDETYNKNTLLKNVPFTSLIQQFRGKKTRVRAKTEFVIVTNHLKNNQYFHHNEGRFKARIECKWQQVPGTTQEKLCYTLMNLAVNAPEDNIIMILEGGAFDEGIVNYIKYMAHQINNKQICIMDMKEFDNFCQEAL